MEKSLLVSQGAQLAQGQIFEPTYLNLGYIYNLIFNTIIEVLRFILSPFLAVGPLENDFWRIVFWFISIIFLATLLWVFWKYHEIRKAEDEKYEEILEKTKEDVSETMRNTRWNKVLDHLDSLNESDWKLGIMEADTMLGEILDAQGYIGETIGEQLQEIERGDFRTLDQAWEAHKVRNKIAHEGSDFAITKREAERVIKLYKEVFEEFRYI